MRIYTILVHSILLGIAHVASAQQLLSLKQNAVQSSTQVGFTAALAVDGNENTCSRTTLSNVPFW